MAWSPQQISQRLRINFPDDEGPRISHETIYQSLFIEGRGALKRELVACLRTGRALREPRARSQNKPRVMSPPTLSLTNVQLMRRIAGSLGIGRGI
jgi:IS30 family transposase